MIVFSLYKVAIAGLVLSLAFSPFDCILALPCSFSILFLHFEELLEKRKYFSNYIKFNNLRKKSHTSVKYKYFRSVWKDYFISGFIFCFFHFTSSLFWISHSLTIDLANYWWLIPLTVIIIPSCFACLMAIAITMPYIYLQLLTFKISNYHSNTSIYSEIFGIKISYLLILAGFWTSMEIIRSYFLLPFPWLFIGYTGVQYSYIMQLAPIVGVHGISFFLVIFSGIYWLYNRQFTLFIIASIMILFINKIYIQNQTQDNTISLPISIIQPNHDILLFANEEKKYDMLLHISNLTKKATGNIIVWPESGVPILMPYNVHTVFFIADLFQQNQVLITGGDLYDENNNFFYNTMLMIDKNGSINSRYIKTQLVPFGEYIPWRNLLGKIKNIVLPHSDFQPGHQLQRNFIYNKNNDHDIISDLNDKSLPSINNINISQYICYEIAFSPFVFNNQKINTNLIINITNDGWFGKTIGPHQHLAIAQMRAAEYNIPLIRAANTGISAIIDKKGYILKKSSIASSEVINYSVTVDRSHKQTIYSLYSLYIILIIPLFSIFTGYFFQNKLYKKLY